MHLEDKYNENREEDVCWIWHLRNFWWLPEFGREQKQGD